MNAPRKIVYFAYGSNMFTRRLQERTPSARKVGLAYAEGKRLFFDKESADGSGKCDVRSNGNDNDRAWGVLFEIDALETGALDSAEGRGYGYDRDDAFDVIHEDGTPMQVVAYVATKTDPDRVPYDWYKAFVVEGAREHDLPEDYQSWLQGTGSQADPDAKRSAKNAEILTDS